MRAAFVLVLCAVLCAGCATHSITAPSVRAHMEFLASDAMNGRGSGTRDEWIAATYIASQLRRWGLDPLGDDGGFVQAVELARVQVSAPPVLTAQGLRLTHGKEMIVQGLATLRLTGPLQKYQSGTAVTDGAVVLLPEGQFANPAVMAKAAAVLTVENEQIRSRWEMQAARPLSLPARLVALPAQPAGFIRSFSRITLDRTSYAAVTALADGTPVTMEAAGSDVRSHTWNVVAQLKGRDASKSGEAILLTAHLDHIGGNGNGPDRIFNGADDDASGSAAVLELAEALAKGKRTKRSVVFAWFGSEEAGGFGARYFVERPPVPLERIVANLEFEMIGRPDAAVAAHTLWLTGYDRTNLGPEFARRGARIVADPHPDQNFFERSDNIVLARKGVVAQTVSSYGLHRDYHQVSDDLAHLDVGHMTESIQSMLAPVRWLANSGFTPSWLPGKRP